ncbi:GAF domain-containing protein [Pontixanthobacter aestiaquae]|uniref:GAF domain-containing protein n=1 Tax=Pontixanthobacter aestiaquae TaxID=1509367 RepID=A0A844Z445_9SPHN|nr:GAF domain-containing protein [Pontixanthobacter aestiaquae]MDN3646906.1 GAF domain-containing protein [Pontixanthobacter aestiaquae]MXO82112.1 GAF domain-containing protein [Pontixanthobacter aestiaquae]
MFDFAPDPDLPKKERYRQLANAAQALIADEPDRVANMANVAALMWEFIPDLNWAGFYRVIDGELVLGPFVGRPACIRISMGAGVCGAAASEGATLLVEDVHAFPGHIACDSASQSELVVPVMRDGAVCAVIDLDSPNLSRFNAEDAAGVEALAKILEGRI